MSGQWSAGASRIISGGNTSDMPPTFVLTQRSPQEAASNIAMQKASVKLVLRNMWPRRSTFGTSLLWTLPSNSTFSAMLYLSHISFSRYIFGPSPPTIKCTLGCFLIISGMISTRRSTPLRKVSLHILTMLMVPFGERRLGSGVNLQVSTELGIT